MANTFTQIYIHSVFAVRGRECLIKSDWKNELYKYITGIIQNNSHKMLAINGMPDHVHTFFEMKPTQSVSGLIQDIKGNSSKWINKKRFIPGKFHWQEGFGAFSYAHSQLDHVISYIMDQEKHHRKRSFREEYIGLLKKFNIDFDTKYILNEVKEVYRS